MVQESSSAQKREIEGETLVQSLSLAPRVGVKEVSAMADGARITVFGHITRTKAMGKKKVFITLRHGLDTVQGIFVDAEDSCEITGEETPLTMSQVKALSQESYVKVEGEVADVKVPVTACTVSAKEIRVKRVILVSLAEDLPFQIKDTQWTHEERQGDTEHPTVSFSKRLNWRCVDLRTVETQSIFRVYSEVMRLFREHLLGEGYLEIRTPKILGGASEGGADVFHVSYFGEKATLAQSPQLYKQMAIIGGLQKVFEIGACYRAENSNTGRHLTEFTGVDLERELMNESYIELVKEIYRMFRYIIIEVQRTRSSELAAIEAITGTPNATVVPETPCIITFKEAIDILRSLGRECSYTEDIGTEDERELGAEIRKRHGTDLFAVVEYPESARPFYTSLSGTAGYTQSFDFILKGEEITSGAERIHEKQKLIERVQAKGVSLSSVQSYIDAFSFGTPRHGGCGIGLERVVKLVTGAGDIHKCSMFPRDPGRLSP